MNPHVEKDRWISLYVLGSGVTILLEVQILFFRRDDVDCRQKELNMIERSACNCSHFMWKWTSQGIDAKTSHTTSCAPDICCHEHIIKVEHPYNIIPSFSINKLKLWSDFGRYQLPKMRFKVVWFIYFVVNM
jgi:hypothetical protein